MKKLMSLLLALCLVVGMIPLAASAEDETPIMDVETLRQELNSATSGSRVKLTGNVTVSDTGLTGGYGSAAITVPAGVTLDGDGFSIIAETWSSENQYHVVSVENATSGTTTIQNLTIEGNANTKSGIHAYNCVGTVAISNVTIKNCGNAAVQVNGAAVMAENLVTSENAWGAVNVDKGSASETPSFTLTGDNTNLGEPLKVWTELTSDDDVISVPESWTQVSGSGNNAYAPTESLTKNVVYNETTGTYYQSLELAVKQAQEADVLAVYPGNYNIQQDDTTVVRGQTGWYLPIDKSLTIRGVDADGNEITDAAQTQANIYSTDYSANGAWATQNLITVLTNDVTISGLTIMNKIAANKSVEVTSDASNFTIQNCTFAPIAEELLEGLDSNDLGGYTYDAHKEYGASLYFNGNVSNAQVKGNYFDHSGITFDSTDKASITVTDNIFEGVKNWDNDPDYTYSSIGFTSWNTPKVTDISDARLTIEENQFINAGKVNFYNVTNGQVDVSGNYWDGMDLTEDILGGENNAVIITNVYADKEMTKKVDVSTGKESLQDRIDAAETGAVIDLGGQYWPGNLVIDKSITLKNGYVDTVTAIGDIDGLTFQGITFRNVSTEKNSDTNPSALYLQGTGQISNVLVDGCTFQGPDSDETTIAITTLNVDGLTVQDSTIDGYTISAYHNPGEGGNITYQDNTFKNIQSGIGFIATDGITVTGNTFENANGIRLEPGWNNGEPKCSDITIEENKFLSVSSDDTYGQYAVRLQNSVGNAGVAEDEEIDLGYNYWGTANPDFDELIVAPEGIQAITEPYYEAVTMRPQDLNTYTPSTPVIPSNPGGDDDEPEEPEEPAMPFTDVTTGAWYYGAVEYVYENNLMAGTGDTTFDPEMNLTRAMTAQILYNLEGKPEVAEGATFADMGTAPNWSVDAIAWAQDTGVVAGIGNNLFDPNTNVTREAFAQMMYNYAKFKGYDLTKAGDLTKFPDAGSVSTWAETAMSWANGNGLINGHAESGLLDPQGTTTRAQAASIIANFDKHVVK